jgi:hypothetical protein
VHELVLWHDAAEFVYGILCHYIHWSHTDAKNQRDAGEGGGEAVPELDGFSDQFAK